jgi:hypothetical protein
MERVSFGSYWAEAARSAAIAFRHGFKNKDAGITLLTDIRTVFNALSMLTISNTASQAPGTSERSGFAPYLIRDIAKVVAGAPKRFSTFGAMVIAAESMQTLFCRLTASLL